MRQKWGYWTIDKALEIANNFKNRTSFCKKESGAYYFLIKKNMLDRACEHMAIKEKETAPQISFPEIDYSSFENVLKFVNTEVYCYKGEIWKEHPIYSFVEASNFGRIRTKTRIIEIKYKNGKTLTRKIEGRIIKQNEHIKGSSYLAPSIRLNNKSIFTKTHRIVCECFYGISDKVVDHKNGIKYDNRIENLKYATFKENSNNEITSLKRNRNTIKGYNRENYFIKYNVHKNEIFVKFKKDYSISNYGVIRHDKTNEYTYGYEMGGYLLFSRQRVHRIVAKIFLSNPSNYTIVDHIDGNKKNNTAWNLRWVNRSENANNPNTKKGEKRVFQYSLSGNLIKAFNSLSSVKEEGFDYRLVSAVCLGKRKTHGGYVWKYS